MRTMRLSALLVVLAACSSLAQRAEQAETAERADRVQRLNASATLVSGEPVLVRSFAGAVNHGRTDTLSWTDSITRGDTTLVTRSRAISTTQVLTDSQWVHIAFPIL